MCPGKYGRHTSLPFLRPPLTTALLTLGKAQQVNLPASACALISSVLRVCLVVLVVSYSGVCFLAERHAREWAGPPEPPAHAARTTAAPAHQRQTHQQCKAGISAPPCGFSAEKTLRVLQAQLLFSDARPRPNAASINSSSLFDPPLPPLPRCRSPACSGTRPGCWCRKRCLCGLPACCSWGRASWETPLQVSAAMLG